MEHREHPFGLRVTIVALSVVLGASCGDSESKGSSDAGDDALTRQDAGEGDGDQGDGDSNAGDGDASRDAGEAGPCGTRGGKTCAKDELCDFAGTVQCGALDQGGVCTKKPLACTQIIASVCGCDDRTYASACAAHSAGVSVQREGTCEGNGDGDGDGTPDDEQGSGKTCGGFANLQCDKGEFCNYEERAGGMGCSARLVDGTGACRPIPTGCTRESAPVCGCDGNEYANECSAHALSVSVAHAGTCP